jgi:hypothetical protein
MSLSWKDYLSSDPSFKHVTDALLDLSSLPSIHAEDDPAEVAQSILDRYALTDMIQYPFEHLPYTFAISPSMLDEAGLDKSAFIMPSEDDHILNSFFSNHEFFADDS